MTNCQLMQKISASESTSAEESTTFNVCKGVINCTGICIDLFEVDTSTEVHVMREREPYIEASLPFKNPCLIQKRPEPLLHLLCFL